MKNKRELLDKMSEAVLEMDDELVIDTCTEYIKNSYDALEGITDGLANGMSKAGDLYEMGDYYIPELLLCSDAMYQGIDLLKPHIEQKSEKESNLVAVIAVVEGDTHDIGKNLFKIMLETVGFDVYDLGRDVPTDHIIEKAKEVKASLIGLSTLMTTTMQNMAILINKLEAEKIRNNFIVMVGGGPISAEFAKKIGANGYEPDATSAANTAKDLVISKLSIIQS